MERVKFSALAIGEKFILDGNVWNKKTDGYAMFRHLGNSVKIEPDKEVIKVQSSDFMPVAFFDGKLYVLEEPFSGKISVKEFNSAEEALIAKAKKELTAYDRGVI